MIEPVTPTRHIEAMTAKPDNPHPQPQPSLEKSVNQPGNSPGDHPGDHPGDQPKQPREIGGPKGPEPTRYGDWEVGGRCTDF